MNKLVKQKPETNELKTGLSVLSYRITQNVKELTAKNLKTQILVCHIAVSTVLYSVYCVGRLVDKTLECEDLLI